MSLTGIRDGHVEFAQVGSARGPYRRPVAVAAP